MQIQAVAESPNRRDASLDVLKAWAILAVLYWHLKPITLVGTGNSFFVKLFKYANFFIYTEICLVAVPLFFTISLYLFFLKQKSSEYALRRVWRIGQLYLFWAAVQMVVFIIATGRLPELTVQLLYMGGPPLPLVGDSVFYFIFNLLLLVLVATGYTYLSDGNRRRFSCAIVLICAALFCIGYFVPGLRPAYYSFNNFVIYVPLAYYLARYAADAKSRRRAWFFGFICCVAVDSMFLISALLFSVGDGLPVYSRMTNVFAVLFIFSFREHVPLLASEIMQYVGICSLGIFALHKYAMLLALYIIPVEYLRFYGGAGLDIHWMVCTIVAMALTAGTIAALLRSPLRRYVV